MFIGKSKRNPEISKYKTERKVPLKVIHSERSDISSHKGNVRISRTSFTIIHVHTPERTVLYPRRQLRYLGHEIINLQIEIRIRNIAHNFKQNKI